MISSKWAVWDRKKSKFIKQCKTSWLLSNLGIKMLLNEVSLLGPFLF